MKNLFILFSLIFVLASPVFAQADADAKARAEYIRYNYAKYEYEIPMRDGKTMFTAVYVPNAKSKKYPFLMVRTPYSARPYGISKYAEKLGPNPIFEKDGFIFVVQDVRGRYRSEGEFVNVRPQDAYKRGKGAIDDATDTYDTIEWLVNNVAGNNGKVGMWGISYPGFYASVGSVNAHPALKAVSPQAPVTDWFFDDFRRNGAFVPSMAFRFFDSFDNQPDQKYSHPVKGEVKPWTHDGYQFYRDLGPLSNVNKKYFHGKRPFWNDLEAHPNYDDFWKDRNILQHLKNTKPATLVVGGWYDTEDLYGPLATYQTMSQGNKLDHVKIVMGPWFHGQWSRGDGSSMGEAQFGFNTSKWIQENIVLPFFQENLKSAGNKHISTATVFETGANRWRTFDAWPPQKAQAKTLYFAANEKLVANADANGGGSSDYISDPNKPVPHSKAIGPGWDRPYMAEDQRFTARRPDVLVFETEILTDDMTIAGALNLDLKFSTTGTAADLVVKLVDVFPGIDENTNELDTKTGNRHELVRWGSIRGRFRNSMSEPEPFKAGEVATVKYDLYDVLHTFKRGHKIQIQVQSSMFPFLDRNPQTYIENIFDAKPEDFIKATHRLHHNKDNVSRVTFRVLK